MKKKEEGIYTTHGKEEKLIATKAKVNGILSLAFVKNGELISYEPWEDINKQMFTGNYIEFNDVKAM
jgi:hypothetical protein|nr:MAG TPA: hypothetical protein [Caudoviricetes sp.]